MIGGAETPTEGRATFGSIHFQSCRLFLNPVRTIRESASYYALGHGFDRRLMWKVLKCVQDQGVHNKMT